MTLLSMADERQAQQMLRFFKTGAGEYGEGDKFLGLRNPQVRMVVKEAWKATGISEAALRAADFARTISQSNECQGLGDDSEDF